MKNVKSEKSTWFSAQCKQTAAIDFPSFSLITKQILFVSPHNPQFSFIVGVRIIKSLVFYLSLE